MKADVCRLAASSMWYNLFLMRAFLHSYYGKLSSFIWCFNGTQKRNGDGSQTGQSWIQENRRLKLDTGPETWTDWKKIPQNKARKKGYCESSDKLELIKPNSCIKAQRSRLDLLATSVSLGHYLRVQLLDQHTGEQISNQDQRGTGEHVIQKRL